MSSPAPEPKTLHAFLRSRASIRKFSERSVERQVLQQVLETACWAASAHNRQPWRFVVLPDQTALKRLMAAMVEDYQQALQRAGMTRAEIEQRINTRAVMIGGAAMGVLLCLNSEDVDHYPDDPQRNAGEHTMAVQSVALAGGQLLLAAHAEGLGAVWLGAPLFAQKAVVTAFDLPLSWQPQALILLGYPAEETGERQRKALTEVVRYIC